jgi:hypothetical protein
MHMSINNLILVFLHIKIKKKSEKVEYPCLASNITRINSVIHFTQNTVHIRVKLNFIGIVRLRLTPITHIIAVLVFTGYCQT